MKQLHKKQKLGQKSIKYRTFTILFTLHCTESFQISIWKKPVLEQKFLLFNYQGTVVQSVVRLTSSLRVISLIVIADSSHFFSKKFQNICVSLNVNFNESLTNDVVSFEQLGPEEEHKVYWLHKQSHKIIAHVQQNSCLMESSLQPEYTFKMAATITMQDVVTSHVFLPLDNQNNSM